MSFLQRLGFYGIGVFIGCIFLAIFLSGKKTSCDYGPNARVLKNVSIKERDVNPSALAQLISIGQDTSVITHVFKNGKVDFDKSDTSLDSCKVYFINSQLKNKNFEVQVRNCAKKAYVDQIYVSDISN